ncbi:MAG: hypothetical protein JXK94_12970 [Deltaproteobacteria bacterium]|nr:hypothetical protein [Deltaproteobacteria bacterium]
MSDQTSSKAQQPHQNVSQEEVEEAIARGAQRYFDFCREGVAGFIDRHFCYPGAVATNRVALGWDMLRAPANLFWAPVYALLSLVKCLVRKQARLAWLYRPLDRVPAGFTTRVQQRISELILLDLLKMDRSTSLLEEYIIESLQDVYESHTDVPVDSRQFQQLIEPLVDQALIQYRVTRTASADITNCLSCSIAGAFAFQKFTPGGVGIAVLLASVVAKTMAARDFIFGETLGNVYYSWFPPETSLALTVGIWAGIMALLAAFAALSGIITDPFQAATGLHRWRLHKMLNHLQVDFLDQTRSSFRPKDQFVARILEAFDMIRSGLLKQLQ